jgi:HD-GYP domain-containing protein (c-di-GMP phosphodiesterase class II)
VTIADDFKSSAKADQQIEMVSEELAQTYEELVLLYKMSTGMKVTESVSNYLQMACDNLTDLVNVEGIAIVLEKETRNEKSLVLTAGSGLIDIDQKMSDILYDRLSEQINCGKDALLDSEVDAPFKYAWPERIKNIIAVPLYGKDKIMGLMVAINRLDRPDFDSTDVKLFNSIANECAVFIENGRLFADLKELFIGSLKALTNSIDAKDQYTRGHSERVAFISRWIAERLAEQEPLEEDTLHRIYLAGLLHDIGKIGINEALLSKDGELTEDELNQIKSHPAMGANILAEIKQMNDIVPGVLCHHERVDGAGYPNGLKGDQIPLISKIVMLADSFDAMTSKRVYRNALSIQTAFEEIEKGLGTQFDEKIGRLFLNGDRYQLWQVIQDGMVEGSGRSSFSVYGKLAVGTLLR